jgi:hypothetical protein
MPRKPSPGSAVAAAAALSLAVLGSASAFGPPPPAADAARLLTPVELKPTSCDNLKIHLEPAGDFRKIECSKGQTGYGGETGWSMASKIFATDAISWLLILHDEAGVQTYFERQGPQSLFAEWMDEAVDGSWTTGPSSKGYAVSRFFSNFDGVKLPCFAFTQFGSHVSRSQGYRQRVAGIYCEIITSEKPVSDQRIKEMLGKIETNMF